MIPLDFFQSIIPFVFVLVVVYGSLQVAGVFKNKASNMIIAIVLAFFAITTDFVAEFIFAVFPYAVIMFIIFFFVAVVKKSLFSGREGKGPDSTILIIICVLFLILLSIYGTDIGNFLSPIGISGESLLWIVGLIVIVAIFYIAYKKNG